MTAVILRRLGLQQFFSRRFPGFHWGYLLRTGVGLLVLMSGCTSVPPTSAPEPSPTLTPVPSPMVSPTPTATQAPSLITLTIWVPDFLDPSNPDSGAEILSDQLSVFSREHPDIQVQVMVKKAEGPGGLYNLLSTAAPAAPAVLPDLVILSESDLRTAARNSIVRLIPRETVAEAELFPFAWESVSVEGQVYGVPYLAQVQQTVYREALATRAPLSWTVVLTGGYSLLFPAAPVSGVADDALLTTYLGSGGVVVDETGAPTLDRARLEEMYRYFDTLIDASLLNIDLALQIPDAETSWAAYQQGKGALGIVPAGQYWRNPLRSSRPGWIPTRTGEPVALARSWSLALVTTDPVRQDAALQLAQWLSEPEPLAQLSAATGLLPVRRQALVLWPLSLDGVQFVTLLLERAYAPPPPAVDQPVRRALQSGLGALLRDRAVSPEEAATVALTVLRH